MQDRTGELLGNGATGGDENRVGMLCPGEAPWGRAEGGGGAQGQGRAPELV